jgi:hypothetical protein
VEAQVKVLTRLLTKALTISDRYDWTDLYWFCTTLLNNSFHESIQSVPSTLVFGSRTFDDGGLGLNHGKHLQSRLLQLPGFKEDIAELKKIIDKRLAFARETLEKTRITMAEHYNKGKFENNLLKTGDIVFVKNFSQAVSGTSIKLRPTLYCSPFMVVDTAAKTVLCVRLTDGYSIQCHLDFVRKYRSKDPMFASLPAEVLQVLGEPLTEEALLKLAEHDQLPIIYLDHPTRRPSAAARPTTRAEAARRNAQLQEAAAAGHESNDRNWLDLPADDAEDDADVDDVPLVGRSADDPPPRVLRFARPQEE